MCDPVTLAGVALTAASTGVNYAASRNVEAARDDALNAEHLRQTQLDQQANAINAGTRKKFDNFDAKQGKRGKQLSDYFTHERADEPMPGTALPTSASNVTVQAEKQARGAAKDFTDQTGQALGQLRSFGDLLGDKSIAQAQDASQVGQIGSFKTGSANVLPYELDDANHAGDGLKLFGDLVGGVGGLTLMKGLSSAAPFKPNTTLGGFLGGTQMPGGPMATGRMADLFSVPGYARIN